MDLAHGFITDPITAEYSGTHPLVAFVESIENNITHQIDRLVVQPYNYVKQTSINAIQGSSNLVNDVVFTGAEALYRYAGGNNWRYQTRSAYGQALETGKPALDIIADFGSSTVSGIGSATYNIGAGLVQGVADLTFIPQTYQYFTGSISAQEFSDRTFDAGITYLTLGFGLRKTALGQMTVTQAAKVAAKNAVNGGRNIGRVARNAFSGVYSAEDISRSLDDLLEANAQRRLIEYETLAGDQAHFYSRHGAQTTLQQQHLRANKGFLPDGGIAFKNPGTRFLSHRDQLNAVQAAQKIYNRTGKRAFPFDAGSIIGEGFKVDSTDIIRTSNVQAVFDSQGNLKTLYPLLKVLP